MAYEVQTRFIMSWENCWTEDDKPLTFETKKEAQDALREHLDDCRNAVKAGHMDSVPPRSDFRIVETT